MFSTFNLLEKNFSVGKTLLWKVDFFLFISMTIIKGPGPFYLFLFAKTRSEKPYEETLKEACNYRIYWDLILHSDFPTNRPIFPITINALSYKYWVLFKLYKNFFLKQFFLIIKNCCKKSVFCIFITTTDDAVRKALIFVSFPNNKEGNFLKKLKKKVFQKLWWCFRKENIEITLLWFSFENKNHWYCKLQVLMKLTRFFTFQSPQNYCIFLLFNIILIIFCLVI